MDYSIITDDVIVGTTPSQIDYGRLRQLGVRLVINMRFFHGAPPKDRALGMRYVQLRAADTPLLPIPVESLERGAIEAIEVIRSGAKVYVHCSKGRHRGPAMAAAILVAQGMAPEEAVRIIKAKRKVADPGVGYVRRRIELFAERWRQREGAAKSRT